MSKKYTVLAVVLVAVIGAVAVFRPFDTGPEAQPGGAYTQNDSVAESARNASTEAGENTQAESDAETPALDDAQPVNMAESSGLMEQVDPTDVADGASGNQSLQRSLFVDGTIDAMAATSFATDESFSELLAELQAHSSDISIEKQTEFQTQFFDHPLGQDGSVSLDVIECGSRLCAAELRSSSASDLESLIRETTDSASFMGRVVVEIPGSEIYSHGESRRLLFSHDPAVDGISIDTDTFERSIRATMQD